MKADYVIVGSGLTGATIARLLRDRKKEVIVVERRSHIGGNVHDFTPECGIRMHTYGPHYFRTDSEAVWEFVNRFSSFRKFEAVLMTRVGSRLENWPIQVEYIEKKIGLHWKPSFTGNPANFEEAALSLMPAKIYEKFVKGYNSKMWGTDPKRLSSSLCRRFDVRTNGDKRLFPKKHQGLPKEGYECFISRMLENIPVLLNVDYLKMKDAIRARRKVVFTGSIDEYFGYNLGRLRYRGQDRIHRFYPGKTFMYPVCQINDPSARAKHIREIEWKHLLPASTARSLSGTMITREIPVESRNADGREYPYPDAKNADLHQKYRELLGRERSLIVCGRLGNYRYLDMDHCIEAAHREFDENIA